MREILTRWRIDSGSDFVTVMYFDETPAVADQRLALGVFWSGVDAICAGSTTWTVFTNGREISAATGELTGAWSEGTLQSDSGDGAGDQTADAVQGLIRWETGIIQDGRFLKGRSFVPGLASTVIVDGNLSSAAQTAVNNACTTFASSGAGLVIWHRPQGTNPGGTGDVTAGSAWSELAVLRQRRG